MNGITLKIDKSGFEKKIGTVVDNIENTKPAMKQVGAMMKSSIRLNFQDSGRPETWKKLKNRKGQPLRDKNRLMNSITVRARKDSVRVGTNVIYAAVQHFGAKKHSFGSFTFTVPAHRRKVTGRNRKGGVSGRKKVASGITFVKAHKRTMKLPWGDIPARPFMLLQDEDWLYAETILARHILRGDTQ